MLFANFIDDLLGNLCIGACVLLAILWYALKSLADAAVDVSTTLAESETARVLLDAAAQALLDDE